MKNDPQADCSIVVCIEFTKQDQIQGILHSFQNFQGDPFLMYFIRWNFVCGHCTLAANGCFDIFFFGRVPCLFFICRNLERESTQGSKKGHDFRWNNSDHPHSPRMNVERWVWTRKWCDFHVLFLNLVFIYSCFD